ncbi:hypothetical protein FA95DRAFT_1577014, partial [Auriscalpium vulgare]
MDNTDSRPVLNEAEQHPSTAHSTPSRESDPIPNPDRLWDLEKKQWPSYAVSTVWKCGVKTVQPYIGYRSKKPNFDLEAVELLAEAGLQADIDDNSPVVFLEWDAAKNKQMVEDVRSHLSRGMFIVVRGILNDGLKFDEESFEEIAGSLDEVKCYQSANLRHSGDKNSFHEHTTMRQFLEMSGESGQCGNMLDVPQTQGNTPRLIRCIADDCWSLQIDPKASYEKTGRDLQTKIKEAITKIHKNDPEVRSMVMKEVDELKKSAKEAREKLSVNQNIIRPMMVQRKARRDVLAAQADSRDFRITNDHKAIQLFAGDAIRLRNWDILTHAGFLTHVHHDANGMATWGTVNDGAKLWGIVRFRDEDVARCHDEATLKALFVKAVHDGTHSLTMEHFDIYVVLLEPGDTFIMSPGTWHPVYTPVNSVVRGGHFLCFDTLHLTQWARFIDTDRARMAMSLKGL